MGHFGRITSLKDLPSEKALIDYVAQAAELNEKGIKKAGRKKKPPLRIPSYLSAALQKHARAKKTFANFSPSQRREYVEWLTEAKREETRKQRLKTAIEWMSEGKPRNWKYIRTART